MRREPAVDDPEDIRMTVEYLQGDEVTGCADDQVFKSVSAEKLSAMARAMGRRGGMVRVKKGLASLTEERRREIALQGVEARRKKRAERDCDPEAGDPPENPKL